MRVGTFLGHAVLIGAACVPARFAAADGKERPFDGSEIANPWDQTTAALVVHCGDPGHCPPIHSSVVLPPKDGGAAPVPGAPLVDGPDARVLAGHAGALLADPSLLQARRDAQQWSLADPDQSGFGQGTRLHFVGSTHFGERVVLASTSPATRLADPALDGRADAIVMAAALGAVGRTVPLGVWYDGASWWAYDESGAKLAVGERVLYLDAADKGGTATHVAANDYGGIGLVLDDPRLNGKPDAVLVAQHAFRRQRSASPLASFYDAGQARWIVYNADGSVLALDETIHFIVGP